MSSTDFIQELFPIPEDLLKPVPVEEGASIFIIPNRIDADIQDFRDDIMQHIGQTSRNLFGNLLKKQDATSPIPLKKLSIINAIELILAQEAVFRTQLPPDLLLDDRIQLALKDFQNNLKNTNPYIQDILSDFQSYIESSHFES